MLVLRISKQELAKFKLDVTTVTAAGRNFEFVLILAATLEKSHMTTTTWCPKALDLSTCYRMHLFWLVCD